MELKKEFSANYRKHLRTSASLNKNLYVKNHAHLRGLLTMCALKA